MNTTSDTQNRDKVSPNGNTVGVYDLIKVALLTRDLSIADLARRVGYSYGYVKHAMAGTKAPEHCTPCRQAISNVLQTQFWPDITPDTTPTPA